MGMRAIGFCNDEGRSFVDGEGKAVIVFLRGFECDRFSESAIFESAIGFCNDEGRSFLLKVGKAIAVEK